MSDAHELSDPRALAQLDNFTLQWKSGNPAVRLGFVISLFFFDGTKLEKRIGLCNVMRDYYSIFKDKINRYQKINAGKLTKTKDSSFLDYFEDQAREIEGEKSFVPRMYGLFEGQIDGPTPYYAGGSCLGIDRFLPPGSDMEAYIPASWVVQVGFAAVIELVRRWCEILQPVHGTAGLGTIFQQATGRGSIGLIAFPALKRFPGLDYSDNVSWNTRGSDTQEPVIRTTNWLNIVDPARTDTLGGLAAIEKQLGPDCPVIPYDGGVIIKAGPRPELGDVNRGLVPQPYRTVARVLKPLVFTGFGKTGWLAVPDPLDPREETLKWLNRFN